MKQTLIPLFFVMLFSMSFAQSSVQLSSRHGHLWSMSGNEKLDRISVQQLLDSEHFTLYKQARREYVAAMPLWGLTGTGITSAVIFASIGGYYDNTFVYDPVYHNTNVSFIFYIFSGFTAGVAILSSIPAIVLTVDSQKKLKRIVTEYNTSVNNVTLRFGCVNNGTIGLTLNF